MTLRFVDLIWMRSRSELHGQHLVRHAVYPGNSQSFHLMSIVPYNAETQIVYHDPMNKIIVVHNNLDNTFLLLDAVPEYDDDDYNIVHHRTKHEVYCPSCGTLLDPESLPKDDLPEFGRTGSEGVDRSPMTTDVTTRPPRVTKNYTISNGRDISMRNLPTGFMHHDYFKLLANLPYRVNLNAIASAESDSLPRELFNQGYFKRFFRMVSPGILGSGAHAQVYKVMHVLKDFHLGVFAVKRINVGDHSRYLDQVLNEVLILYELSAKGTNENNLIRYNHVWMETGQLAELGTIYLGNDGASPDMTEEMPFVYILQQYCDGGHLENLISSNFQREQKMSAKQRLEKERQKRRYQKHHHGDAPSNDRPAWLSDLEIWKFFKDIANGVNYLHSHGILHRDLKPSNCLLETKYSPLVVEDYTSIELFEKVVQDLPRILVSDFGEGKFINKQQRLNLPKFEEERRGNTGTLEFTDPKLWICSNPMDTNDSRRTFAYSFTYNSDIYSLGMILCYLCTGSLPFHDHISDSTDPELIRDDIETWHRMLNPDNFHLWFQDHVLAVKSAFSDVMTDFENLIYMMLKEMNGAPKPTSQEIMDYLESMKWSRFLNDRERKHSEATITEVPKSTVENGDDFGDTLDLLKVESIPETLIVHEYDYLRLKFTAGHILLLAILEIIDPLEYFKMVKIAKYANVLSLTMVMMIPSRVQFVLLVLCFILTAHVSYGAIGTAY